VLHDLTEHRFCRAQAVAREYMDEHLGMVPITQSAPFSRLDGGDEGVTAAGGC
jgi:hypothetical protein